MNRKLLFFNLAIFFLFVVNSTNAQSTSESLAISSFHDRQHCRFLHHGLNVPWSEKGTVEVLYKQDHGLSFFCTNAEDFKSLSETLRYFPFTRTHILYCGDSPITGDACLMGACTYWFSLVPDNSDSAEFFGMNESTSSSFLPNGAEFDTSPEPAFSSTELQTAFAAAVAEDETFMSTELGQRMLAEFEGNSPGTFLASMTVNTTPIDPGAGMKEPLCLTLNVPRVGENAPDELILSCIGLYQHFANRSGQCYKTRPVGFPPGTACRTAWSRCIKALCPGDFPDDGNDWQAGHVPDVCLGGAWAPLCVMPQPKECNVDILSKLCTGRPNCVRWNRMQLKWQDGGLVTISEAGTGLSPEIFEQANELKRVRTDKLCRSECFRTGDVADCWMEHPDENRNAILELVQKVFAPAP